MGTSSEKLKKEYQETFLASNNKIKLCIVGQDIYPTGYNGVAFCKDSFEELYKKNCCGHYVLYSLGYSKEYVEQKFNNPKELFFSLLKNVGIAFINVSYELIKDAKKNKQTIDYNKFKDYNLSFLEKAENIIVLGIETEKLFKKYYTLNAKVYIHPSLYNKNNKYTKERWLEVWNEEYLKSTYLDNK